MKTIKALVSFVYIGANGSITSYAGGQVYEVANEIATQFISIGYAEEYSEGGGGSSDFSTAEVTVVGNEQNQVIMNGAVAQTFPSGSPITAGTTYSFSTTADVVLYKGTAVIQINNPSGKTVSVSGSIQNMSANAYIVTGDCTITIS